MRQNVQNRPILLAKTLISLKSLIMWNIPKFSNEQKKMVGSI